MHCDNERYNTKMFEIFIDFYRNVPEKAWISDWNNALHLTEYHLKD